MAFTNSSHNQCTYPEASSLSEMQRGLQDPDLEGPEEYPEELKFDSEVVLELQPAPEAEAGENAWKGDRKFMLIPPGPPQTSLPAEAASAMECILAEGDSASDSSSDMGVTVIEGPPLMSARSKSDG